MGFCYVEVITCLTLNTQSERGPTMKTEELEIKLKKCRIKPETGGVLRERLSDVTESIITSCADPECFTHVDYEPIPSVESVVEIINRLREIIFPGYFNSTRLNPDNLKYNMGQSVSEVYGLLGEQIANAIRHDCYRYQKECSDCREQGQRTAIALLESLPDIRRILAKDVKATFVGDPSARSHDEIIFSFPGIKAIMIYRIAHLLHEMKIPILPRNMTEYAHATTGIDIHPGAEIGESFVIDHGTGVVIGETTEIGKNVRVYQGVTLGAHSLPIDAGKRMKGMKRHPTIEDNVIIYSGATILGGNTVIGEGSIIGGNVWLTESVPPKTKVIMETPRLVYN